MQNEKTPLTAVKDSGVRQNFATGSRRDSREGKGRFDLIPPSLLNVLARHLEDGSVKYGDRNWEKGQPISRYIDSAMRHMLKYWAGYVDEMHLHASLWNQMAIVETEEKILNGELPESLDDHPRKDIAPLFLRVFRHVAFPENLSECWNWVGPANAYAPIYVNRIQKEFPHKIVCEQVHGPAPFEGAEVLHTCDNRVCVNPRHLSWSSLTDENIKRKNGHDVG